MLSRTSYLATQLRKGSHIPLLLKNYGKNFVPLKTSLNVFKNYKLIHQQCRESVCKRKPKKQAILVFLVGHARYTETVDHLRQTAYKLCFLLIRQCEVHIGLKIRNFLHFYCFYSRIWGEEMTAKMFGGYRKSLMAKTKMFFCSVLPVSVIDWQKHMIPDEKFDEAIQEYTTVHELCTATVHCQVCLRRKIVDNQIEEIDYCKCEGKLSYTDSSCVYDSWEPFIERKNTLVWRKEHPQHKNMYCYKVYGKYKDISANSFAEVQLNTFNRLEWDSTALELTVVGSDPSSMSDLLYWKVKFPAFFADRDYLYKRRYRVDENRKEIIIVGESMQHEKYPKIKGIHRVEDYWAIMVIKADKDFHMPGMSYTLTYFDNPGTTLPNSITTLIASKSFPDFLCNVHNVACQMQRKWDEGKDTYVTLPDSLRYRSNIPFVNVEEAKDASISILPNDAETESIIGGLKTKLKKLVTHSDFEDNAKFPIVFRNAVVDLLEATEVIGPELSKQTLLATKFQELINKLLSEEQSVLLDKLLRLSEKTIEVLSDCSAKKEESLRIMRQLQKRSHYWHYDEGAQLLLAKFFNTITENLRTDRDLRTGKILVKSQEDQPKSQVEANNSECNVQKSSRQREVCPCCTKPLNKSLDKSKELSSEQCPNCDCNMSSFSPYYTISSHICRWNISLFRDVTCAEDTLDDPAKFTRSRTYAWYFYPIISTWNLILSLLRPWSHGAT